MSLDSLSSGGHFSTTSGLSSPAKSSYGPAPLRGGISSFMPLGNASSNPTSPSTPTMGRDSTTSSFSQGFRIRPSVETYSERIIPGYSNEPISRATPPEQRKEAPHQHAAPANTLVPLIDPRLQGTGKGSPAGHLRRSARMPSLVHHDTSDSSSKSSIGSSLSGPSTAASSLQYSPRLIDDGTKATLSLPPLSTVGVTSGGGLLYPDSISRPNFGIEALATRAGLSCDPGSKSQSPFNHSSSTTGKFESLQLPLPHNISFGQRPLPRSTKEEKLANIFDLQDMPRERTSMRNLSLEQPQGSVTPTSLPGLPEPRHPPHQPALPKLPALTSHHHGTPDPPILHPNADPLSVLAYAGRIVGREYRPPS